MVRFFHLFAVCALVLCFTQGEVLAATPVVHVQLSPIVAVNKSERLRMLTQRMVKVYCQIHLGLREGAAERILQDSMDIFDSELHALSAAASSPELRKAVAHEQEIWFRIKPLLLEETSLDGVRRLNDFGESLAVAAQTLDELLEKQSHKRGIEWMDLAGRQRTLSQQIVKFYLLRKLGVHTQDAGKGIEKVMQEFNKLQITLLQGAQNTPDIVDELHSVSTQWEKMVGVLNNPAAKPSDLDTLIVTSERILEILDHATTLFEQTYDTGDIH